MMRRHSTAIGVLSLATVVGCGKAAETEPQQAAQPHGQSYGPPGSYGPPPDGYGAPIAPTQPGAYGGPPPPPGQVAPLGAVLADPAAAQNILAGAVAGGAAILGALVGGEQAPLDEGIKSVAETQAKGMTPQGQLMTARLAANGHAEASLTLKPGSCYTVIGFGGPGTLDFRINLVTAPPMPPQVLAQSAGGSVTPVVGPNEQCVRSPYPLPLVVKVDMQLLRGQGLVGARVYKR